MAYSSRPLFDPPIVKRAIRDSFVKLNPAHLVRNPVMFVVMIGSVLTTLVVVRDAVTGHGELGFSIQLTLWLWFTVLFANFAEAMAEGRGKAQADTLRKSRTQTVAKRLLSRDDRGHFETVPSSSLTKGDYVVALPGDVIPGDGDVVEGVASVDESAITGESAPVIRESGGDRSAVTGGTRVLSDYLVIRITANAGETFLDRMIALVEGATRQKTPNEIALTILLSGLTIVFLLAVVTLQPFAIYSGTAISIPVLVALLVCLIPTTIGGLLSAIGIAGMDRVIQQNVIAMSGRSVEAAGDVNTLLLDKTGTITLGNRQAVEFVPMPGVTPEQLADRAQLASLADETPEGRSIVVLAKEKFGLRGRQLSDAENVLPPAQLAAVGAEVGTVRIASQESTSIAQPKECRVRAVQRVHAHERRQPARRRRAAQRRRRLDQSLGAGEQWRDPPGARRRGRADRARGWDAARGRREDQWSRAGARHHLPQGHREGRHARAVRSLAGHGHSHGDDHGR